MANDEIPWYILLVAGVGIGALFMWWMSNQRTVSASANRVIASNNETWNWIDYRGQDRSITVTREVKG